MIAIADSGSSKTDWVVIDNYGGEVLRLQMEGLNPYHLSKSAIYEFTKTAFSSFRHNNEISEIYFYGAGCANNQMKDVVKKGIGLVFHNADIQVESDILGAARALFQKKNGVAIILGTGSNTVLYNGNDIGKGIKSMGYILGDEGSGSVLGRQILQAYFRNEMADELALDLKETYKVSREIVLKRLYKTPAPNQYLASFSKFAGKHKNHPFVKQLIAQNFEDYFKYQLKILEVEKNMMLGVVGSIGYYFSDIFALIAKNHGYRNCSFLQHPIEGLLKYHINEL